MEGNERGKEEEEEEELEVWSWGAGTDGQLGTGKLQDELFPQLLTLSGLSSGGSISLLACGGAHVIVLTSRGEVLTWGRGTSGQLGHGEMVNILEPKPVTSLEDVGCLFTCGDGSFGQLGHGDHRSHSTPVKVSYFGSKSVEQIACGMRHSLVLLKGCLEDQIYGFGSGKRGQLGISKDHIRSSCLPQVTVGLVGIEIVSISASGDHSAALSADGHLYTWGRGFNRHSDTTTPQCLPSSLHFTQVALGWNHALVLTGNREVYMLGGIRHGVLGDPQKMNLSGDFSGDSRETALENIPCPNRRKYIHIAAGAEHSAIVTEDGEVKTWGWGEHGQLGLGNTCDLTSPQVVDLRRKSNRHAIYRVYCGSGFTFALKTTCFS